MRLVNPLYTRKSAQVNDERFPLSGYPTGIWTAEIDCVVLKILLKAPFSRFISSHSFALLR
jgi:hypothetical protein